MERYLRAGLRHSLGEENTINGKVSPYLITSLEEWEGTERMERMWEQYQAWSCSVLMRYRFATYPSCYHGWFSNSRLYT
jgi:hypothetical protein